MTAYRGNRAKKVKLLKSQISQIENEKEKVRKGEEELKRLSKLFPTQADSGVVVESLYRFAKESGLKQHDIATESTNKQTSTRPTEANKDSIVKHSIKISVLGSFRQIAEYIKLIQSMERFNRITEFKLTPFENMVSGTITVEIFSIPRVKP